MKTFTSLLAALSSVVLAVACSSSTTPSSTSSSSQPGSADEASLAAEVCQAYANPVCSGDAGSSNDECLAARGTCMARLYRPEAIHAFKQCMQTRSCKNDGGCQCDKSDDDCFHLVGNGLPANPVRDTYVNACQTKLAECGKGSSSFSDDWCTPGGYGFEMFTDAVYSDLKSCFENACGNGTIQECLDGKLKALGCDD